MSRQFWNAVLTACLLLPTFAVAAPPDVKFFSPAGGQRGKEVTVTVNGTFSDWPVEVSVSDAGVRFQPSDKKGIFNVFIDPQAVPGPRWVRFIVGDGISIARPFIVGVLPEVSEKEPNDTRKQAVVVGEQPTVVNGALGTAGDVDLFQVTLQQGRTFVASLAANSVLGSAVDGVLQLLDAEGNVLAQNIDDRGLDPRVVYKPTRDGVYFVRVFGFTAVPATAVKYHGAEDAVYRLTLTAGPIVDFAYPPIISQSNPEPVTLRGWNLPAELPPIVVPAPANNVTRGTHWLSHDFAGEANVQWTDVPVIVASSAANKAPREIPTPVVVVNTLSQSGERHEYAVTAKKGTPLRVRVISNALGFPLDPVVKIYKPDGTLLIRLDDTAKEPDVDGTLTPAVDGVYRVDVEDLFGDGGERYVYALDIRPVASDFGLSFTATQFTAEIGKPFELAVNIDRPTALTDDIAVQLEGLPAEFAPAAVTSVGKGAEAKNSSKKVVFKFTPDKTFSGPLRVTGTLQNAAATVRTATASSTVLPGTKFDDVWLTVVPAGKVPAPPPAAKKK